MVVIAVLAGRLPVADAPGAGARALTTAGQCAVFSGDTLWYETPFVRPANCYDVRCTHGRRCVLSVNCMAGMRAYIV